MCDTVGAAAYIRVLSVSEATSVEFFMIPSKWYKWAPADAVALETEFSQVQVAWLVLMFHCPTFTTNLAWQGWPRQILLLEERHFGYPSKARKSLPNLPK